jgi:hypothetical protein
MLSTLSVNLKKLKPKLCIGCKYFISDNDSEKFGKCSLFPKIEDNNMYYLVNGNKDVEIIDYSYCVNVRSDDTRCGKEGKFHKKKISTTPLKPC